MNKKILTAMIAMAGVVLLVGIASVAAQQNGPSATRSFDKASVAPGGQVVVTIQVANYGGIGRVTETLPAGFDYVSSTHDSAGVSVDGQEVRFTLQGDASVAYTVTASSTAGSHSFSGMLRDSVRDDNPVGGVDTVTVEAPSTPTPSATRSFDKASVAPGGQVVVTIQVANYGGIGRVTETLPAGFDYVSSTHDSAGVSVNGQEVRFTLQGDASVAYTVTASSTAGSHSFSGMLRDSVRDDNPVGGVDTVTVEAPSTPTPSATRSFDKASVAPGGQVVVTIQVANYGGIGRVTETLPAGFDYVSSTHDSAGVSVNGQEVRFTLQGDASVAYTVTASSTAGSPLLLGYAQGLRHERSHRRRRYEGHGGGTECHSVLQLDIGGPRWKGSGHHPGRQLRGHWTGDGDAARRVRLRIQHPRLGGSECERPGGSVHAARGCLRRLHGHRLQDGGVPLLLGYAQGLRHERSHGRRRYQDHGS